MEKMTFLSILLIAFFTFSCEKETFNSLKPEENNLSDNPVLEKIRAIGLDINTVVDYNDAYYLVEGDILIPKVIDQGTSNLRHISFTHEFSQKRAINIYLKKNFVSLYNNLDQALNIAINAYNNVQGARLSMARVYDEKLADIVIEKEMNEDNANATAVILINTIIDNNVGIIGENIYVAEDFCTKFNAATVSQLAHTLVHEIGHCIGRLHTDTPYSLYYYKGYTNFDLIPGSPESDPTSVMNAYSGNWIWNGFSHWDVVALRRLFPAIAKSNVSLMFVDRNTSYVGYISGAERYQYSPLAPSKYYFTDVYSDYCVDPKDFGLIYAIQKKNTASGRTEINLTRYKEGIRLNLVTPLHQTNDNWTFTIGDFNQDGKYDIICINRHNTASNKTTIHVLNGASNFNSWLWHCETPLGVTNGNWDFTSGDVNKDGKIDVICVNKQNTANDKTTIHVLNGATNYTTWLSHAVTPLHRTGANFEFFGGDYNNDGRADLYAIKKSRTGTNSTEVHILNGANNFQNYLVQIGTSLPEVSDNIEFCN